MDHGRIMLAFWLKFFSQCMPVLCHFSNCIWDFNFAVEMVCFFNWAICKRFNRLQESVIVKSSNAVPYRSVAFIRKTKAQYLN